MTALSVRFALYLAGSLLIGMSAREYARAFMATRLHDPTPRLWGRLTFNPKVWFEPFGSGLLPAMILVLWAFLAGFLRRRSPRKPAPSAELLHNTRDTVVTSLADRHQSGAGGDRRL